MSNAEDHALGLELQLIELVERQTRAQVQHRDADVAAVQAEIDDLQRELAELAEHLDDGDARHPGFREPALPVRDQLEAEGA